MDCVSGVEEVGGGGGLKGGGNRGGVSRVLGGGGGEWEHRVDDRVKLKCTAK